MSMKDGLEQFYPHRYSWMYIDDQKLVNNYIRIAIDVDPPPLFNTLEMDGMIIKEYSFIKEAISKDDYAKEDFQEEFTEGQYLLNIGYKREIEDQLNINRSHCLKQYDKIKQLVADWINSGFKDVAKPLDLKKGPQLQVSPGHEGLITIFFQQINKNIRYIMNGVKYDVVKNKEPNEFVFEVNDSSLAFSEEEFFEVIEKPLQTINRIISRSLKLYYEYVAIHSLIYGLKPEAILNKSEDLKKREIYFQILNAKEGIRVGKVAFVKYIKEEFDYRTYEQALEAADEIHRELKGEPIYANKNSFDSSKSQVDESTIYEILNRVK